MSLVRDLRALDELKLSPEALQLARRDLIDRAAEHCPAVRLGSMSKVVGPIVGINRKLANNPSACWGEEFNSLAKEVPVEVVKTIVGCECLTQTFDPNHYRKWYVADLLEKATMCGVIGVAAALLLPKFGSPPISLYFIWGAMSVVLIFYALISLQILGFKKKAIHDRLVSANETEEIAQYLDACAESAFELDRTAA